MTITRDHFYKIVDDAFGSIRKLSGSKGTEYAGHEVNTNELANFDRLSADLQVTPEKVLWVYTTKHLDSIKTYINKIRAGDIGMSNDSAKMSEPIEGRIDDAILYLLLLKAMVVRRRMDTASAAKVAQNMSQGTVVSGANGPFDRVTTSIDYEASPRRVGGLAIMPHDNESLG